MNIKTHNINLIKTTNDTNVNITTKNSIDYKISTMTVSCQFPNCELNLINIGKYLEIDDEIIGIKYNYGETNIMKGKYATGIYKKSKNKNADKINKNLFYNQVSIICKITDNLDQPTDNKNTGNEKTDNENTDNENMDNKNLINVKLFGNGSLHLTGVKDEHSILKVMKLLYNKLILLTEKTDKILLMSDSNNILLDNDNIIYSKSNPKVILGYKTGLKYNINKKFYTIDNFYQLFISEKFESKRSRHLLDFDGNYAGICKIELLKNKNKLYKKNANIYFDKSNLNEKTKSCLIYHDSDNKSTVIGKITYDINDTIDTINKIDKIDIIDTNNRNDSNNNCKNIKNQILEYNYSCNPFKKIYGVTILHNDIDLIKSIDINCINIFFDLKYQLNRQRLFNNLLEKGYMTEYKPEKYSGVKLIYKINQNYNLQNNLEVIKCSSTKKSNDAYMLGICTCNNKCTCNNITFLIFQSGNIIACGFRKISEIDLILYSFKHLMNSLESNIKKKLCF